MLAVKMLLLKAHNINQIKNFSSIVGASQGQIHEELVLKHDDHLDKSDDEIYINRYWERG